MISRLIFLVQDVADRIAVQGMECGQELGAKMSV